MGSAIVACMLKSGHFRPFQVSAVIPSNSPHLQIAKDLGIKIIYDKIDSIEEFDILIFAVKPQTLPEILPHYKALIGDRSDKLIVSIAAGKKIDYFKSYFPKAPIVRVMPNINITIEKGATVGCASLNLSSEYKKQIEKIFGSAGFYSWIDDESKMDLVTAVSGSGPAYYFLFTELLSKVGEELGLPKELSAELAKHTFTGSASMLEESNYDPSILRQMVTSKGGTTEAAVNSFENNELRKLIKLAVESAIKRGNDLSK